MCPHSTRPYCVHSSKSFSSWPASMATLGGDIVAMFFLPSILSFWIIGRNFSISSSALICFSL